MWSDAMRLWQTEKIGDLENTNNAMVYWRTEINGDLKILHL